MNRKERRAMNKKGRKKGGDLGQMAALASAFRKAKAAGEDDFFLALGPSSVTAMWTGPVGQKRVEQLLETLAGRPFDLSGKQMCNWVAQTVEEKELVQQMREGSRG
jgi:hypothetical protein